MRLTNLTLILFALIAFGFTSTTDQLTGTYGTCEAACSCVQLTLNDDHTFTYVDKTGTINPTQITGEWHMKGHVVTLQSDESASYHNKWKVNKDGESIRSRKGILFYTLRRSE